ncbi:hypothetical protein PR048_008376 [Dryococelus australis]|uniref:Uncharacterized protein n=1 Tax=Dryococelus australis TaxID=614101 RepID=A0ABQ9HWX9_9NEOP|nr:hypothetical protein PR048_008376 [Dryococelus australis]
MTTCANTLKTIFSEEMVHIQCWAHKLNIVSSLWSSTLCIQYTKHSSLNARKRKHKFVTFLKQKYPDEEKNHYCFLH